MRMFQDFQRVIETLEALLKAILILSVPVFAVSAILTKTVFKPSPTYKIDKFIVDAPSSAKISEPSFTGSILKNISDIQAKSNSSFETTTTRMPNGEDIKIDYKAGPISIADIVGIVSLTFRNEQTFSGELYYIGKIPHLNMRVDGNPIYLSPKFSENDGVDVVSLEASKAILARIQPQRYAEYLVQTKKLDKNNIQKNKPSLEESKEILRFQIENARDKDRLKIILFALAKIQFYTGYLDDAIKLTKRGLDLDDKGNEDPFGLTFLSRLYYFHGMTSLSIQEGYKAKEAWERLCFNIGDPAADKLKCADKYNASETSRRALFFSTLGMIAAQEGADLIYRKQPEEAARKFCLAANSFAMQVRFERDEYEKPDVAWDALENYVRAGKCRYDISDVKTIAYSSDKTKFEGSALVQMRIAELRKDWKAALRYALIADQVHRVQEPAKEVQRRSMHTPQIALFAAYSGLEAQFDHDIEQMPKSCEQCTKVLSLIYREGLSDKNVSKAKLLN